MKFKKMERAVESTITVFVILTILYVINVFVNFIYIPPILVSIGLALFAVVFVLRPVFWKKNEIKWITGSSLYKFHNYKFFNFKFAAIGVKQLAKRSLMPIFLPTKVEYFERFLENWMKVYIAFSRP